MCSTGKNFMSRDLEKSISMNKKNNSWQFDLLMLVLLILWVWVVIENCTPQN